MYIHTTSTSQPNHGKKKENIFIHYSEKLRIPLIKNPGKNSFISMLCQRTWKNSLTSAVTRPVLRIQLIQVYNGGFAKITPSQI